MRSDVASGMFRPSGVDGYGADLGAIIRTLPVRAPDIKHNRQY